jgi:RNA polymerase sigma factor (sigma-70 family)
MTGSGLRAIFLTERRMLLRMLTARLGDPDAAEEVLQELWIKLDTAPAQTGPIAQPGAYLFRMANNLAFDRRRSAMRNATRDTEWLSLQTTAEELPDMEEALIARERLAQVEAALAALPERTARVFRRYRFENIQQKVIAQDLGVSLSTIEKLLQQAYRAIHDHIHRATAPKTLASRILVSKNLTGGASQRRLTDDKDGDR